MRWPRGSTAYDLQELFRFLVDLAVIQPIETDAMEKKDCIRTERYTLRLRPSGARKVTEAVSTWLNRTVEYQGKKVVWSYVMLLKARELAHYLAGKKWTLDLLKPEYQIVRPDSEDVPRKLATMFYGMIVAFVDERSEKSRLFRDGTGRVHERVYENRSSMLTKRTGQGDVLHNTNIQRITTHLRWRTSRPIGKPDPVGHTERPLVSPSS